MSVPIVINTDPVPSSFCIQDIQTDWPVLVNLLNAAFQSNVATINFGNSTPSPDNQQWPWFRVNSDGTPDKWYTYTSGNWLAPHSIQLEGHTIIWTGSEASIPTLDGGEVATTTTITGPFWEKVDEFDGRFPVGVGTLAGSTLGTAVTVGSQGGTIQANFKLKEEYMPAIQLKFGCEKSDVTEDDDTKQPFGMIRADSGSDINYIKANEKQQKVGLTNTFGSTSLITDEIVPPHYGVFFIKRTARMYHRA